MIKRFFAVQLFFCFSIWQSFSQEVVFPLNTNPVIKQYLKANPPSPHSIAQQTSTLVLPFIDDFSKPTGIYPDPQLWQDSGAFINSTFCDVPITVGVATLDGIDKKGNPYDSLSGGSTICDYLTSQPIDLSGVTIADSLYFSFYYQPQGLGDEPETGDSLVLEFLSSDLTWNYIWSHDGEPDKPFKRDTIKIYDAKYLWSGFQFRFYNYATPNGNRDHWNIDYVYLDKSKYDFLPVDIGFINQPSSLLKEYQSMPWLHYKKYSAFSSLVKTSFTDSIRNIGYGPTTLTYNANVYDEQGISKYANGPVIVSSNSGASNIFTNTLTNPFDTIYTADSVSFLVKDYCSPQGQNIYVYNDTVRYYQRFYNYYAYDDGSAELQYGIPEASSKLAFKFNVKVPDTLWGLQIYFNPSGFPVHNSFFQICYWDQVNISANTEHLVYKEMYQTVANMDSINGFVTYFFNSPSPLVVSGDIYVGIIQDEATPIGVGVDVNTNSNSKMFAYYTNQWHQSGVTGSWMIRPIFGKNLRVGINELNTDLTQFDLFPNPTSTQVTIYGLDFTGKHNYSIKIYDMMGREMIHSNSEIQDSKLTFDVTSLPAGIYFVRISDGRNGSSVKKLVIQR